MINSTIGEPGWVTLIICTVIALVFVGCCGLIYSIASSIISKNELPIKIDKITEDDLKAKRALKKYIRRKKP